MKLIYKYCTCGLIAPNGDYYGIDDPDVIYAHLRLADDLVKSKVIPKTKNPERWLELNGWIKHSGSNVVILDSKENENPMTEAQIKTLADVLGQEWMILNFVNQEKFIFINDLLNLDKWQLHYELIT